MMQQEPQQAKDRVETAMQRVIEKRANNQDKYHDK